MPGSEPSCFCHIVAGVYTPVLKKRSQNFRLADGLAADYSPQFGQCRSFSVFLPLPSTAHLPVKRLIRGIGQLNSEQIAGNPSLTIDAVDLLHDPVRPLNG